MRIEGINNSQPIESIERTSRGNSELKKENTSKEMDISTQNQDANRQLNEEEIIQAIEKANKGVKTYDRRLKFSIHERTKEIMVKVIDTSGDKEKVIREIPPEKVLDMVAKMWEMAGILVDEKA